MLDYRFYHELGEGTWRVQIIPFDDDDGAISHGLRIRTANRCELYQAERWVATFDGAGPHGHDKRHPANENVTRRFAAS